MIFRLLRIYGGFRCFCHFFPQHKILHIDDIRFSKAQSFLLDQPDSLLWIQFCKKLDGGLPAASHVFADIVDLEKDIHPPLFVEPFILYRQRHPIQQKAVKDLCLTWKLFEVRIGKQCFRNPVKSVGIRLHSIEIIKNYGLIHSNTPPSIWFGYYAFWCFVSSTVIGWQKQTPAWVFLRSGFYRQK